MNLMRSCSVMRSLSGEKMGYVEESSSWDPDDEVRLGADSATRGQEREGQGLTCSWHGGPSPEMNEREEQRHII